MKLSVGMDDQVLVVEVGCSNGLSKEEYDQPLKYSRLFSARLKEAC
jgi:hypothetical protein